MPRLVNSRWLDVHAYRVVVEGVFVVPPGPDKMLLGFYSTVYVEASDERVARLQVEAPVREGMAAHHVVGVCGALISEYYLVHEIEEVTHESCIENRSADSGFTFLRIGLLERFWLAVRGLSAARAGRLILGGQ